MTPDKKTAAVTPEPKPEFLTTTQQDVIIPNINMEIDPTKLKPKTNTEPEPILTADERKAKAIAELKKAIEDAQRVLKENESKREENRQKRKEIERELEEIRKAKKEVKPEKKETLEVDTFSTEYIKKQIEKLLTQSKQIKEIESVEVVGKNNEITLNIKVTAGPLYSNVGIQATLENKQGNIVVKDHNIDAGSLIKGTVKKLLIPKLNEISEILKSYIEAGKGKKVQKMEIKNGELEVTYK